MSKEDVNCQLMPVKIAADFVKVIVENIFHVCGIQIF